MYMYIHILHMLIVYIPWTMYEGSSFFIIAGSKFLVFANVKDEKWVS